MSKSFTMLTQTLVQKSYLYIFFALNSVIFSICHYSWNNWQTERKQHCISTSWGTSWKLKQDALFVYDMYMYHWYLYFSHLLRYLTNSTASSTGRASAQAYTGGSIIMSHLSITINISISHICWGIWQIALHQHCNSTSSGTSWKLEHDNLFV